MNRSCNSFLDEVHFVLNNKEKAVLVMIKRPLEAVIKALFPMAVICV